jgi:hypothetical protein
LSAEIEEVVADADPCGAGELGEQATEQSLMIAARRLIIVWLAGDGRLISFRH